MRRVSIASVVGFCVLLLAGAAYAAEPLKMRVQHTGSVPTQFGPILEGAADQGIYKHYGKSYTIESVLMRGSGQALLALGAQEIEIAALSYESLVNGVVAAQLDLRVIADVLGSKPGWAEDSFYARKGEFASIKDLKGRIAGVPTRGSSPDAALRHFARKNGLVHGEDYQVVEVGLPNMLPSLESKRIDMGFLVEPFSSQAERTGKLAPVFSSMDALGPRQTVVWVARADVIAKNRAAFVDFMEDHIRLRHWCFDPSKREAVMALVSKVTKRPPEAVDFAFTKRDHWRDPNARPDLGLLQKNIDDGKTIGLLEGAVTIAPKYVDMSLIDDALTRIGGTASR